ncbi:MarR family transcriptional regulator [Niallia taxi]|uniref:MarR family winged helix-turn-helix transcriptional regulator n=1 Tax=Niallia taxi TaxID=2499688 RepID=UPI002E20C62D|nr:MarR family transcriptional regulator [Niallia taxi]MED4057742.1 MarR family transcriptional regulator [Niallia taxi]MED4122278.1 MarR family transcriptional regulator [Niallia taxi]
MEWVSEFKSEKESPGFLLWRVTQAWQRQITKELSSFELTHVQFVLLAACDYMCSQEQTVTQKKLADYTELNVMMISEVVRTLESKDFLERSKNPLDKREILLTTTDKGSQLIKRVIPVVEGIDKRFFAPIEQIHDFNHSLLSLLKIK